ncbi:MAG: GNAT family N-acetyltransferase [Clostridia bacterium]|nr:GNAT family N-acetyltransferase [Clostridia bacterium]
MNEVVFQITDIKQLKTVAMKNEIRELGAGDLAVFNEHLRLCQPKHKRLFFKGASQADWQKWNTDGIRYFVLFADKKPVARCCIEPLNDTQWEAADVKVCTEARGNGFAKQMVCHVSNIILNSGKTATCRTLPTNTAMLKVIDTLGFCAVQRELLPVHGRRMTEEEFPAYAQWSVKGYADYLLYKAEKNRKKALAASQAEFNDVYPDGAQTKDTCLYVVQNEANEDIGVIAFQKSPYNGSCAFITELVIHPDHRRKGYAQSALQYAQADAKEKGFGTMALNVFKNSSAFPVYVCEGFRLIEDYPDSAILEKDL